jgi:hypothetical protein
MHDTGTPSIVYVRYWYYQYYNITILVFLVLYSVTILVLPVLQYLQYWYFQYCEYYNTGNTSIVNITILVIPVSRPAASYYTSRFFTYDYSLWDGGDIRFCGQKQTLIYPFFTLH